MVINYNNFLNNINLYYNNYTTLNDKGNTFAKKL